MLLERNIFYLKIDCVGLMPNHMVQKILHSKNLVLLIVSIILLVFIQYIDGIRRLSYELVPKSGILDEYNYVWQGISLRKEGIPIAWSNLPGYLEGEENNRGVIKDFSISMQNKKITSANFGQFRKLPTAVKQLDYGIGARQVLFVFPFLDHPPLGGLIMSLGVKPSAKTFTDITLGDARKVSLEIAVITSILVFILTYQLTANPLVSLVAVILYSTIPTFLLSSRFALLENILAPFALFQTILLISANHLRSKTKASMALLILAGISSGLMVMVKESGIGFVIGAIIMLFIWRFKFKAFLSYIAPIIVIISLYLLWAFRFSPDVFFLIFNNNSNRGFIGSLNFLSVFQSLKFDGFPLDGWWIWGFISVALVGFKEGCKLAPILIPSISHLLLVLILGSYNFPWYYLGLVPFLAIFTALGLFNIFRSPHFMSVLGFILIPLSSSFYWGYGTLHQPINIWIYRIFFLICLTVASIRILKPQKSIVQITWLLFCLGLFVLVIKWNINSLRFIISHFDKLPFTNLTTF